MFDGVPVEQFHQFISPNASNSFIQTTTPAPTTSTTNLNHFLSFDHPLLFPPPPPPPLPLPTHHQIQLFQESNHQFIPTPPTHDQYNNATTEENDKLVDNQDDIIIDIKLEEDSWSDDEVIQLLRIKSTSSSDQNWYTRDDFTYWDHVSRKLAEMGYKKSAEKCKEKFEEETCRSFSSTIAAAGYNKNNSSCSRSYLISEEEVDEHNDLYNNNAAQNTTHHHSHVTIQSPENIVNHREQPQVQAEKEVEEQQQQNSDDSLQGQKGHFEKDPADQTMVVQPITQDHDSQQMTKSKKRKRKHKRFKMVKGLCVDLVNKMMAQQEEMHKKLLEDMANRDAEKIKREEAWKKEEMERVKREIHFREQEHEMAKDRQSTITHFLNKITSLDQNLHIPFDIIHNFQHIIQNTCDATNINKLPVVPLSDQKPSSSEIKIPEDPHDQDQLTAKEDIGKRWPREEVLALINIRSNVNNGNINEVHNQDQYINIGNNKGGSGGSLWERISQGMLELGFKRSAKRCKEKWENINKYFRKTKDANKKRSLDSRTCPYYHELSKLYNQEKLASSASNSAGVSSLDPDNCLAGKTSKND